MYSVFSYRRVPNAAPVFPEGTDRGMNPATEWLFLIFNFGDAVTAGRCRARSSADTDQMTSRSVPNACAYTFPHSFSCAWPLLFSRRRDVTF